MGKKMKRAKAILWGLILLFFVTLYLQNRPFFETKNSMVFDIYLVDAFKTPEIITAVWGLAAIVSGFLLSYLFSLSEKFRTRKIVRSLKTKIEIQEEMIEELKREQGIDTESKVDPPMDAGDTIDSELPVTTETTSEES